MDAVPKPVCGRVSSELVKQLREQITKRGRDYEKNISDEYLSSLSHYYDDWMLHYGLGKKLIIESDELDFVSSRNDFDMICNRIIQALDQRYIFLDQGGSAARRI